jgi:hypothetical protein
MAQTLTERVEAIKNTPGTGEAAQVSEINSAFDKFDNHFIPAAQLRNTVAQSIPNNATTKTVYSQISYDSYSTRSEGVMASIGTDDITIRRDGLYIVSLVGSFALNATGIRRMGIGKNGTIQTAVQAGGTASGSSQLSITQPFVLADGDIITGHVFQNSGGALDLSDNSFLDGSSLSVTWVGSVDEV